MSITETNQEATAEALQLFEQDIQDPMQIIRQKYFPGMINDEEQTSGTRSGSYLYQTTVTLNALPKAGYTFTNWSDTNMLWQVVQQISL